MDYKGVDTTLQGFVEDCEGGVNSSDDFGDEDSAVWDIFFDSFDLWKDGLYLINIIDCLLFPFVIAMHIM